MDENDIWVKKNDREERLGAQPVVRPQDLAHWTGLKMVRYRLPEEVIDRHIVAPHPIVTWVCRGQTASRLRYGLGEVNTLCTNDDLMFYGGGREIAYAHWRTRDAELVSIELDPLRLSLIEDGDTRFSQRPLQGTPKFNDPTLRHVVAALWAEVEAGCPQGQLYADSLSLGAKRARGSTAHSCAVSTTTSASTSASPSG
jgi:AraC family transcriptional regulator